MRTSSVFIKFCTPCHLHMVQFANIFCSLGSFELFPSLGAIFKQYQLTNHLGDKNLPIILKLQTKKKNKRPQKRWKKKLLLYIRCIQTLFSRVFFACLHPIEGAKHQFNKNWWYRHKCSYLIKVHFDDLISVFCAYRV